MEKQVLLGILVPFAGTALGACMVLFLKNAMNELVQKSVLGFAAGVMVAASIWSLILPSIEQSQNLEKWSFLPALIGFWFGIIILLFLDRKVSQLYIQSQKYGVQEKRAQKTIMLVIAVVLHNIPEGMAVGVLYAGALTENSGITMAAAFTFAAGIAIQNIPEGSIISMPLRSEGMSKQKALFRGILSGAVEPVASILTILISSVIRTMLPYALSFAAGAMMYVVVEDLIPEMSEGKRSYLGVILFTLGFSIMMSLDVALG